MLRIISTLSGGTPVTVPAVRALPAAQPAVVVSAPTAAAMLARRVLPAPTVNLPSVLSAVPRSLFTTPRACQTPRPLLVPARDFSTYTSMHRAVQPPSPQGGMNNGLVLLLLALGAALFGYKLYRDNNPIEIVDKSVLRDDQFDGQDLFVVDGMRLKAIDSEKTGGRSHGHKCCFKNPDGQRDYYYFKKPFSRGGFLSELVLGVLGRELFKTTDCPFPKVYAVERPKMETDNASEYSFISENIGGLQKNYNLEDWVVKSAETGFNPDDFRNLGVAVAFDMVFGHTDCKLANIVRSSVGVPHCYSIDHESAFGMEPKMLESAKAGVSFICEFAEKSYNERLAEQTSDGVVDTDDNIRQPLKANKELKRELRPVLEAAIQADIDNGAVQQFYEKFAALSEDKIKWIASRFGSLLHEEDQIAYVQAIQQRQAVVKRHLAQNIENELRKLYVGTSMERRFS